MSKKNFVFIIILFGLSLHSVGQKLPVPTYKKLVVGNDSINCRRTTDVELDKLMKFKGEPLGTAGIYMRVTEGELNALMERAEKGDYDFYRSNLNGTKNFNTIETYLTYIKTNCPKCDTIDYKNELRFYSKLYLKSIWLKEIQDSIDEENKIAKFNAESKANNQIIENPQKKIMSSSDSLFDQIDNPMLSANMAALAPHGKLTQFTGMDLNFVSSRVQDFMDNIMQYTFSGDPKMDNTKPIKTFVEKYIPKVSFSQSNEFIQFKYFAVVDRKSFTIQTCEITGTLYSLINFYISYWTTKINYEGRKEGEIVHSHLLNDDISFQFFPSSGKGKIVIKSSTEINK